MKDALYDKQEFATKELEAIEPKNCIGCGGRATRTNNTLCQSCWYDAEGQ